MTDDMGKTLYSNRVHAPALIISDRTLLPYVKHNGK